AAVRGRLHSAPGPARSGIGAGRGEAARAGGVRRYSVLALDLDGTLLTDDLRITGRTHAAIRRARERGVAVVLASARPPRSMRRYHRELELDTPLVAYNGALVWDAGD